MATASSGARRVIRPQVDTAGDDVLAELQQKLKFRKGASEPNPRKQPPPSGGHKKLGAIGKSISLSEKQSHNVSSTSVGGGQVATKWHVQFSSTPTSDKQDQVTPTAPIAIPGSGQKTIENNGSNYSSPLRAPNRQQPMSKSLPKQSLGRIGPPPKIPPPQFDKSSYSSSNNKLQNIRPQPPQSPPPLLTSNTGRSVPLSKSTVGWAIRSNADSSKSPPASSKEHSSQNNKPKKKISIEKLSSSAGGAKKELKRLFGRNKGRVASEPKDLLHRITSNDITVSSSSVGLESTSVDDPMSNPAYGGYQNMFDFDKRRQVVSPEGTPSPTSSRTNKKPKPLPRKNSISSSAVHSTDQESPQFRFSESESFANRIKLSTSSTDDEDYVESFNELEDEIDKLADIAKLPPLSRAVPNKSSDNHMTTFERKKQQLCKTFSHNPVASVPIERRTTPKDRKELRHGICSEGAQISQADEDNEEYIAMNAISMFDLTDSDSMATLGVPTSNYPLDPRASGYYLKILPSKNDITISAGGGNKIKPPVPVSYAEFRRQNPIPVSNAKEKQLLSSPSTEFVESDGGSDNEANKQRSQPIHLLRQTKITSSEMMSPRHHPPINIRTSNSIGDGRRFKVNNLKPKSAAGKTVQYSDVTIETSTDIKRKPSVPKKYRYQMVKLNKESKPVIDAGQTSNDQPAPQLPQRSAAPTSDANEQASKYQAQENGAVDSKERIYYVTSSNLSDRPGGLNRPPPLSRSVPAGRTMWHEYVEIDEEKLDAKKTSESEQMQATTVELNASTNTMAEDIPPPRADSTSSTDSQPYKVKPPEVPYRPDNLDEFIEHTRNSSSGDYSYAAVPGLNLFGVQWLKFHARHFPNMPLPAPLARNTPAKSEGITSSFAASSVGSVKEKEGPPTLPPKTLSLLREQGLVKVQPNEQKMEEAAQPRVLGPPQPYLNFVPLSSSKTRSSSELPLTNIFSKKNRSQSVDVSLPAATFTSYVSDPNEVRTSSPTAQLAEDRGRSPPPKPVPYKNSARSSPPPKPQPYKSVKLKSVDSNSSLHSSKSGTKLAASIQDKHVRELSSSDVKTRELTRTKAHRKLSRQRSFGAGHMSTGSMKRKSSMRHKKYNVTITTESHDPSDTMTTSEGDETIPVLPPKQNSNQTTATAVESEQVVQRRKAKQTVTGGVERKIDRRSLAIILQNKDTISKHLSQACDMGTLERNRQVSPNQAERGTNETESEKVRDLGDILLEVDMLLRKKVCTENDLLSAIESQLNIKLQAIREDATTSDQTGATTDQGKEIECDSTVEITDKDVEQVVQYVSDNRIHVTAESNGDHHPYENQTYDVMNETQGIDHPYQNQVYGMKNESVKSSETQRQLSETDGYENLRDWTGNNASTDADSTAANTSEILISVPLESKPRSRTFVEVNVDELEKQALSMNAPQQSHDSHLTSTDHYNVPRVRSKSNVTLSPTHQSTVRPRLTSAINDDKLKQPAAVTVTSTTSPAGQLQLLHTKGSVDESTSASNVVSPSYELALKMEDDKFSASYAGQPSSISKIQDGSQTSTNDGGVQNEATEQETKDERSYSTGQRPLRRVNARRRSSASSTADVTSTITSFTGGTGVFTHKGGKLTNIGSGVEVEIPENAVPKGKKQKIWFDVLQTVMDPSNEEDMINSLSDSGNFQMENYLIEKKDRRVQLSPMVLVGPCEAMLNRPIKIKLPHCLPYRNNSWHLQLQGRAQNCESEDWTELTNSFGLVEPPAKRGKNKFYKKSCYQMHIDYVQVRTSQLGCFKLMGTPIRNGTHTAKKMVTSVFTKKEPERVDSILLDVFITNAIQDQVQALETSLNGCGYVCVERNIPVLLFGDGRDMELMLSTETNSATPLGTKVIPFGEFWRQKKVGQSHVSFQVDNNMLAKDPSRTLTLRIQQAGAKFVHETNFVVS